MGSMKILVGATKQYLLLFVTLQHPLVYDQNRYFGLGLILKPKFANIFCRYLYWYWNHISNEEYT